MKPNSFWVETAPAFTKDVPLSGDGRTDVAIVGGGFTGLSAALTLAKKGISVRLLEAGKVAAEASGRNGGHCNNGLSHEFSASPRASASNGRAKCIAPSIRASTLSNGS